MMLHMNVRNAVNTFVKDVVKDFTSIQNEITICLKQFSLLMIVGLRYHNSVVMTLVMTIDAAMMSILMMRKCLLKP